MSGGKVNQCPRSPRHSWLTAQCSLSPSILVVDTCAQSQLPNFPQNHVIYGTVCYDRQDLCVTTNKICAARSNNLWNNHTCMCVLNDG